MDFSLQWSIANEQFDENNLSHMPDFRLFARSYPIFLANMAQ